MRTATRSLAGLFLAVVPLACGGRPERPPEGRAGAGRTAPAAALADLAGRYWERSLEMDPIGATYLGIRRYDDRLPDITPEGREAQLRQAEAFLRELRGIDRSELQGQDLLTWRALEEALQNRLDRAVCAYPEWDVDHRNGPQVAFLNLARVQRVATPEDARNMAARWQAMGPYLDAHVENLRRGLRTGHTPAGVLVGHVIRQLEALLAQPDSAWPLLDPLEAEHAGWSEMERDRFRRALSAAVAGSARPAFRRYLEFLRTEVAPRARTGTEVGVHALPEGDACYAAAVREHTSLDLPAPEIHEFGLRENARIRREMETLGRRLFGTADLAEIQRRLRTDPAMHFGTGEEVYRKAVEATERARAAIPRWFGRLPRAEIVVEEIPDYEAPYTTIAYYREPAADGSRPGTYFINSYAPETRTRYEAEVLAFHEGIPGHHLQIAIAQELEGIPDFRKYRGTTAFVEGWALYAERLADEMNLYSGDLDRLGMLSFDAWRASRLVVDTGIHTFGWSREQAIDYMLQHTLLARNNVENEVDRYIAWPGQALAYKLGQREILSLRDAARERLGERFRIRDFHDVVLGSGAVSLASLRDVVARWIGGGEG